MCFKMLSNTLDTVANDNKEWNNVTTFVFVSSGQRPYQPQLSGPSAYEAMAQHS